MVAKRNHFVPGFYLEYFTAKDKGDVVWVYDKEGGAPRPQKPVDTGVEKYLYTIKQKAGEKDDSLEKWFAGLDGKTKPILDRLIQDIRRAVVKTTQYVSNLPSKTVVTPITATKAKA